MLRAETRKGAAEGPLQDHGWSGRHSKLADTHAAFSRELVVLPRRTARVKLEFLLFGLLLLGVALFHAHTLRIALAGLVVITGYKLLFTAFDISAHFLG